MHPHASLLLFHSDWLGCGSIFELALHHSGLVFCAPVEYL